MNLLDLSDKVILITGGAGAIGQVVVEVLAAHGAAVAVNDAVSREQARAALPAVLARQVEVRPAARALARQGPQPGLPRWAANR